MWRQRIETVQAGGVEAIADAVMGRYFSDAFRAANAATVARFRRRLATTCAEGYVGCCSAVAGVHTAERLPQIAVPTLVIAGELDAGTPPAMSETLAQRIPHARLEVLANAAHLSAVEAPAQFSQAISQFMLGL